MATPDEILKAQIAPLNPLIAASLLNAVYSHLAWRKPMDYDQKTFEEAYTLVVKQRGVIMQNFTEMSFLNK